MSKQIWANGKWVTVAEPTRIARKNGPETDPTLMPRIYAMRDQGSSQAQIGAVLGVHQTCISVWLRRFPRATINRTGNEEFHVKEGK